MIRKWLNNHLDHSETKNYIKMEFFRFCHIFTLLFYLRIILEREFIIINPVLNSFISIDILRESGINSELLMRTIYPNVTLALMNNDVFGSNYNFEQLLLPHMFGSFLFYVIFSVLSMFCLSFELYIGNN